jgi:hypothetical protein
VVRIFPIPPLMPGRRLPKTRSPLDRLLDADRDQLDLAAEMLRRDENAELNQVCLSGVIVADPKSDVDKGGESAVALLVAFLAPGEAREHDLACWEIEAPLAAIVGELGAGVRVLVRGALTSDGRVRASLLSAGRFG